jgi:aminomethyltransferase
MAEDAADLRETPLAAIHRSLGARMVPFAGYSMPVQYSHGILFEHERTRTAAGLFDVSHMGQALLVGPDHGTTAAALEALAPGDFLALPPGRVRYSLLLNEEGGIIDDLMVTRPAAGPEGTLGLVVNAGRKEIDYAHLRSRLPASVRVEPLDRALIALQGPAAAAVIGRHATGAAGLGFMTADRFDLAGVAATVSRSGYTGEDGFEISVEAGDAEALWRRLLAEADVSPIGLGARDSLRLEAGLPLWGHDIDEATTPVEADLAFAVSRRRRAEGGFPGAARILAELRDGPRRRRVGIRPEGKAPAREGTPVAAADGTPLGTVTSGGFGPTVGGPVAMGYVAAAAATPGTPLALTVRGRALPATVATLPFVPHRYHRAQRA